MNRRGIDVLVTPHPSNITYVAGHFSVNIWDLMFLVIPADGQPLLVAWQFERGRFEPHRVSRRRFGLSHAAMAGSSSMA